MTAKKRLLLILVAILMVFAMMPMSAGAVYAVNGDPAMVAGTESVLKQAANEHNAQTVWYAGNAWRVIKYKDIGNKYIIYPEGQNNTMTLFAANLLATDKQFKSDYQTTYVANYYAVSDL